MIKFVYKRDSESVFDDGECGDPKKVVVQTDAITASQLLEDFKSFLKGIGYGDSTVGRIQLVDKEEELHLIDKSDFMKNFDGIGDGY
jgi:hypothetical protein